MAHPFQSERLIYRAIESPEDDDFFVQLSGDAMTNMNSSINMVRPRTKKECTDHQTYIKEKCMLGVVICLPANTAAANAKPTPIGELDMTRQFERHPQHRSAEIGIEILPEYQGKGYGTEAIQWALDWAFRRAGMHKVDIGAFEWNYGARKLYERIGFKPEGVIRELFWHDGRFWDDHKFGMIDREWEEIKKAREAGKQ